MSRKYVILDESEVTSVDFNQVLETSADTLRWSVSGPRQTFVKFEGDTPSFLVGKTQHSKEQILNILNDTNGNWHQPEAN